MKRIPLLKWLHVTVQGRDYLAFSYRDPSMGISAKGGLYPTDTDPRTVKELVERPTITIRMESLPYAELPAALVKKLGLPEEPAWLHFYGPQNTPAKPWHNDPLVAAKLHPTHPDDIEALFFFVQERAVEQMWVRLTGPDKEISGYTGTLLNTPHSSSSYKQGDVVSVRMTPGVGPIAARISSTPSAQPGRDLAGMFGVDQFTRQNLLGWESRCMVCGFDLLLLPVKELISAQFKDIPEGGNLTHFTTRCPLCNETMIVKDRRSADTIDDFIKGANEHLQGTQKKADKKWWEIWK